MKICIFGADGRTGVEVVRYAKERGFDVVAFVYNPQADKYLPKDINIKKGDVMNYDAVIDAVRGSDAVISALGHIKNSDPLMQTKGITNIIKAMQETDIKRIISLTGTGVRLPNDKPSLIDQILNFIIKKIDPDRINDGIEHALALQKSDLDWTVVRVLKLTENQKQVANYKLTEGGPAELKTSRKKIGMILVDLIQDHKYIKKMPVVSD